MACSACQSWTTEPCTTYLTSRASPFSSASKPTKRSLFAMSITFLCLGRPTKLGKDSLGFDYPINPHLTCVDPRSMIATKSSLTCWPSSD